MDWRTWESKLKMRGLFNRGEVVKQWFGGGEAVRVGFIILVTTNIDRSLQSLLGEFHTGLMSS